jgi:hypothetical protein
MSEKIQSIHTERDACVYIRQSSMGQVRHHLEGQRRQYDLRERAQSLGFQRVVTIDEDLGRSGTGAVERPGFGRLLSAVCSGRVGAVRAWDDPRSPATLKKRILRTALQEIIANTTDDPPTVHLKLHWAGGSHTELTVRKNKTGYHNHINSEEVTELIRQLALVCEDSGIVSILNRLGYRTGNNNTWTEKRVQHVRHTKGFPACPLPDQRLWLTMHQAAEALRVSDMVVRKLIAQKILPAKQIVKFAPWTIERSHLELPAVRRYIRLVHTNRRASLIAEDNEQTRMFNDLGEM